MIELLGKGDQPCINPLFLQFNCKHKKMLQTIWSVKSKGGGGKPRWPSFCPHRWHFGTFGGDFVQWGCLWGRETASWSTLATLVIFGNGPTYSIWIYRFANRLEHCLSALVIGFTILSWMDAIKRTSTRDPTKNCLREASPTMSGEHCDKWLSAKLS